MALSVSNNMTIHCSGESGETVQGTLPSWIDLDDEHADFGKLSLDALYTDDFYQGASCMAWKNSNANIDTGYVYKVTSNIDLSSAYVLVTVKFNETSKLANKSAGGIAIVVLDSSGNYGQWYVAGKDTYEGGWVQYLVDCTSTFSNTSTTSPTMTAIRSIGISCNYATAPARAEHAFVDRIFYGTDPSITVTGTVTTTGNGWSELESISQSVTNRFGMIRKVGGIYEMRGGIKLGDGVGTASLDFSDNQNSKLIWSEAPIGNLDDASFIDVNGNGTGTTDVQLGSLVGTGDARSGYLGGVLSSQGPLFTFDSKTDTADIDTVELYGVVFENAGVISMDGSLTQEAISCQFVKSKQVDPGASEVLNCFFIDTSDTDSSLIWNSNIDIAGSTFIANTTGDAIKHTSAGTYTYDALIFSGNTYDINNTSLATLVDSYTPTEDGDVDVYSGSITRVAQEFTGAAGKLSRAIWSIRKQGTPTGNIVAKLYADSGSHAPTGTALATSNTIAIADLTTSFANVEFEFEDEYTLVASTAYHISIEYAGGDSTNRLEVEYLTAGSASEYCNTYISSWSSQTYDCSFQVNRDGIVIINATNGASPGIARESAAVKGATIIKNAVTLKVTCKNQAGLTLEGIRVRIEETDGTLIDEGTTNSSGVFSSSYNYVGDTNVNVIIRLKGYNNAKASSTITSSGLSVPFTMIRDTAVNLP